MVGKTATPEFAYSSFTDSRLWGVTRNPWNTTRSPGGSSGGSGAAVASGCVPLAEGTDMGGSVRIPASWSRCRRAEAELRPDPARLPADAVRHHPPLRAARAQRRRRAAVPAGRCRPERARHHEPAGARPLRPHADGRRGPPARAGHRPRLLRDRPRRRARGALRGGGAGRRGRGRRGGRRRLDARDPRRLERALGRVPGSDLRPRGRRSTATGWIRACSRSWTPAAR